MYLLDTNILSELIKKRPNPYLLSRLRSQPSHTLFTSGICIMELRFGAALRSDRAEFWFRVKDNIISRVQVVPFSERDALVAGDILAEMRKAGRSPGLEDVLIASSALTNRYTLVTANTRHFSRIQGLRIENWLEEA
ncbi:MAG: PIN domain-containing protein [Deltaproteobacteria bacterium]|nr:PIN domain-containing protein [Deltaproteobacteria bacterium]